MAIREPDKLNPTQCPKCKSVGIVLEEEMPRTPQFIIMARGNLVGIFGDLASQDWRCSSCGHDWRAVETYDTDYLVEGGVLKRKDGRALEEHLFEKGIVSRGETTA